MGAVVLGRYTRVRWRPANPEVRSALAALGASALDAAALLVGADQAWGLAPAQPVLLAGNDVGPSALGEEEQITADRIAQQQFDIRMKLCEERDHDEGYWPSDEAVAAQLCEADRQFVACLDARRPEDQRMIVHLPPAMAENRFEPIPGSGVWLIGVEHGPHQWAALRNIRQMTFDELEVEWSTLHLPGAEPLNLGRPRRGGEPFTLVAPCGSAPAARIDRNGVLLTTPFQPEDGAEDDALPTDPEQLAATLDRGELRSYCRYGVVTDGAMEWLRLAPDHTPWPNTAATMYYRSRLDLFRRELAARGVYYEDDQDETGYELRWSLEDGAVPAAFHESSAPQAYTVSATEELVDEKREQARLAFDPENDWEMGQSEVIDYHIMPSHVEVTATDVIFSDIGEIAGCSVTMTWMGSTLMLAAEAAGLRCSGYRPGWLTTDIHLVDEDKARLADATHPPPVGWSAVEAADRVQRAAYALATGGLPDLMIEAQIARLRGPIVRTLLARDALEAPDLAYRTEAKDFVATLLPLAPGPFPRRAYAVIELADALAEEDRRSSVVADTLQALISSLEQRLSLLFALRAGGAHDVIARGTIPWAFDENPHALILAACRWGVDRVEPLLGSLDPPDAEPVP